MEAIGTIKETESFLAGAETILVRPRTAGESRFFREFLEKVGAAFETAPVPQRAETLEGKITRLYEEGHYTDGDIRRFFSIPKKHRIDPFEVIEDGDVYWADKRNVEELDRRQEEAKWAKERGELIELDTSSPENFWESVRNYAI